MNPVLYIPVAGPQRLGVDVKTAMRVRNMSGGSTGSLESDLSRSWGSTSSSTGFESVGSINSPMGQESSSAGDSSRGGQQQSQSKNILNPGRYKTEMCRPFNETGHCKYGDKCQFAHGSTDQRGLPRHPKYKTELCRTFHTVGFCPYGPRCHFIHSEDEGKLVEINAMKQQQAAQQAAREMAQLQAQQHLLTSQFTALVSQVHLTNHMVSPPSSSSAVYPPQFVTQPPPPHHPCPNMVTNIQTPAGLTLASTLPHHHHQLLLGSTADSPPDSPIGSISDEVFHTMNQVVGDQQPPQQSLDNTVILPTTKVEGLGLALGGLVLAEQHPQAPATFTTAMSVTELTVSPPSSPDSFCSSLDSQRSSRLPVFSKLAGEN